MTQARILVVEDDNGLREALVDTLLLGGYECREVDSGERALLALSRQRFDMVISDIQMGGMDGLTLLANIRQQYPQVPVLLMTAYANIDGAVRAMREGAIDYLAKPFSPEVLLNQVSRYVPAQKVEKRAVVYGDPRTAELFQLATRVARSEATVMVTGPSGTGKEVLARYIHDHSSRAEQAFVAINCAAIPESLIESELFGYQPGAFTGANKNGYIGKIREADGGVLFLDEIGDMPLTLQTRLLRILQEKEVTPLGASRSSPVNFAVICATHRNLAQRVAEGTFREDLLYRLREFALTLPPLREWPELPAFIQRLWRDLGGEKRRVALGPALVQHLATQPWPGNVRQLQSLMRVLLALAEEGETLAVGDLPQEYRSSPAPRPPRGLQQHDAQLIADTLASYNGNISKAAQALGVARSTLYRRAARRGSRF